MQHSEHKIITEDGVEIVVSLIDADEMLYNISSDSEGFQEAFGVTSFQLKKDDSVSENALMGTVIQRNQPRALALLEEIKSVM